MLYITYNITFLSLVPLHFIGVEVMGDFTLLLLHFLSSSEVCFYLGALIGAPGDSNLRPWCSSRAP